MNLLIVDDEYYTVESISNKIRTLRPDFFEIFHPFEYAICMHLQPFEREPVASTCSISSATPGPKA